jgi:hypothetical protein
MGQYHQLLINVDKAYDSTMRKVLLCDIIIEFGILLRLDSIFKCI